MKKIIYILSFALLGIAMTSQVEVKAAKKFACWTDQDCIWMIDMNGNSTEYCQERTCCQDGAITTCTFTGPQVPQD